MKPARGESGVNHDFNFYNAAGLVWKPGTSTYVAWVDADYAMYRVAVTENGSTGRFPVPTPPALAVEYELRERGATLADSPVVYEDVIARTIVSSRTGKDDITHTEKFS